MQPHEARALWPITKSLVYLDSAREMPLAGPVKSAMEKMLRLKEFPNELTDELVFALPRRNRELVARLIGAAPKEIGLVGCTSAGLSALAHALPLAEGDEVLIPSSEFPATAYAWLNAASLRRLAVRFVECKSGILTTERLLSAIGPRTRVIATSLVSFSSGFRCDAEVIGGECRRRGIHLVLDGTQGVGAVETDVRAIGCAALANSCHKWLGSLCTTGFLYVRADLLGELEPPLAHWMQYLPGDGFSSITDFNYRRLSEARMFEMGSTPFVEQGMLQAALELFLGIGIAEVQRHAFALLDRLAAGLGEAGLEIISPPAPPHRSSILCFRHPRAAELQRYLRERRIIVSLREGAIRVSAAVFNSIDEIDLLIEEISNFSSREP